jgi:hypothetical protein
MSKQQAHHTQPSDGESEKGELTGAVGGVDKERRYGREERGAFS